MAKAQKSTWAGLRLSVARKPFPAAVEFVSKLRQLYINGGACFGSFRFPASGPFLAIASRGGLAGSGFFDYLWYTEAVRRILPELAVEPGFRCQPQFT